MVEYVERESDLERRLSDKPLRKPGIDDVLNYAPFAKYMATSLASMSPLDGFVVGCFGEWGMGKSTMINFIKYYLEQFFETEQENSRQASPIIMEFNPWWFSGRENLTRAFIAQLTATLAPHVSEQDKFRKQVEILGTVISGFGLKGARELGELIGNYASGVSDLKARIAGILEDEGRRLIVIMDDIDRLPAEEIREIFRLIKAVADLPNIVYLLAFDQDIVARALDTDYGLAGHAFLEKIIQVPITLPVPEESDLQEMFSEQLSIIIADEDMQDLDQTRWEAVFDKGITPFLGTPRDVVRLTNALAISYPVVRGEVNLVDFLALETLRVFASEVYHHVRSCKQEFTDRPSYDSGGEQEAWREFHRTWLKSSLNKFMNHERKAIKEILVNLFPEFGWAITEGTMGAISARDSWRSELRICSPEMFNVYFRLAVGKRSISVGELKALIEYSDDPQVFAEAIVKFANQPGLFGLTRMAVVLRRLRDLEWKSISIQRRCRIILSFFDIADITRKAKDHRRFDLDESMRLQWLLFDLLWSLPHNERMLSLEKGVTDGKALTFCVQVVGALQQELGEMRQDVFPPKDALVSSKEMKNLQSTCLVRIAAAAQDNTLLASPDLWFVLSTWADWSDRDTVSGWLSQNLQSEDNIILALKGFLPDELMRRFSKKELFRGNYVQRIFAFVDSDVLTAVLEPLLKRQLNDLDRRRIELVLSARVPTSGTAE